MKITIVPDIPCPACGAVADHPDDALRFPNRPKVALDDGVWWWKCYNPACVVAYYHPENAEVELLQCRYFALCDQPAVKMVAHPILDFVPTCQRCLDKIQ